MISKIIFLNFGVRIPILKSLTQCSFWFHLCVPKRITSLFGLQSHPICSVSFYLLNPCCSYLYLSLQNKYTKFAWIIQAFSFLFFHDTYSKWCKDIHKTFGNLKLIPYICSIGQIQAMMTQLSGSSLDIGLVGARL